MLEDDLCPPFDAYGVKTFDLILVCALPFSQILIIHGTVGAAVLCQSDVPSILAKRVKIFALYMEKKKKHGENLWAMGPAIWVMEDKVQQGTRQEREKKINLCF